MIVHWRDHIEVRKDVMMGKPVFKGTRLTVEHVLQKMGAGMSQVELLDNYPTLKPEHVRAASLYDVEMKSRRSYCPILSTYYLNSIFHDPQVRTIMVQKTRLLNGLPRFRLVTLLFMIVLCAVSFSWLAPLVRKHPRFRSEAETRAINAALKQFALMYPRTSPTTIHATPNHDGGWNVKITVVLNPEPGGYREINTFRIDSRFRSEWVGSLEYGSY